MNKLDRIVEEVLEKIKREHGLSFDYESFDDVFFPLAGKEVAQAVAKASFDETNHFVEKLLDNVEDLIERYVLDDAKWMSWIKKQRRKWQDLKKRWCGE